MLNRARNYRLMRFGNLAEIARGIGKLSGCGAAKYHNSACWAACLPDPYILGIVTDKLMLYWIVFPLKTV